jgi:hypothetical protein
LVLRWVSCLLTLCPLPTDRGTIHKVVESGEREHNLVFNIMEIQPFHHAAAIQAISLDTERVSLPIPTPVSRGYPDSWLRTGLLCMHFAYPFKSLWAP